MEMGIYDREEIVERARRRAKFGSAILIASGALSVVVSRAVGLSISFALGLIVLAAGLAHGILAVSARKRKASLWRALVSAAFLAVGTYLIAKPEIAFATLTLAIVALFSIDGAAEFAYFAIARKHDGSAWILADAILTILLAFLVGWSWPRSSAEVLGTIVGVELIASGFTWILHSPAGPSYS